MKDIRKIATLLLCLLLLGSCAKQPEPTPQATSLGLSPREKYVDTEGETIEERFYTPVGARRTDESSGSVGAYTRSIKLKDDSEQVLLYNGQPKENQSEHAAIFIYQTPSDNKQQVAGGVMRIWAEFLYASGRKDDISFMLTNGITFSYAQWKEGYRPDFRAEPKMVKTAEAADDYETFFAYLTALFQYSDIHSLEEELKAVKLADMRIGDVLIAADDEGGHAAMVVDMCKDDDGKTYFMLAGGGNPAQDVHVFRNPGDTGQYVWYELPETDSEIATPEYTFPKGSLKRFIDL